MIARPLDDTLARLPGRDAADRLAQAARAAGTHDEAIDAVRLILEDILS